MKRVITIIALAFCLSGLVFAQTVWQGRVAKGGSQDFPSEGYYAASNSFPRNTIVSVTNPTTGKTIRVVISRGLTDSSMFMTLSADAARSLGLDGNFPATMSAVPVIVPGVSDQSIGAELPFNRDPDVNPAAAAGNSTTTASTSELSSRTVAQPPNQSLVQSSAQAAGSQKAPAAQAATNQIAAPDLNAVALSNASQTQVAASQKATDLDLSATTAIGSQTDALPSEVLTKDAQEALSGSPLPDEPKPTAAPPTGTPASPMLPATTTQVATSELGETPLTPPTETPQGQAASGSIADANQAGSNLPLTRTTPPVSPTVNPDTQNLVKAADNPAAVQALVPAIQAPVLPASVPATNPPIAGNSLSGSPAVAGVSPSQAIAKTNGTSNQAVSGGTVPLVPASASMVANKAASAGTEASAPDGQAPVPNGAASLLAGVKAGSPKNPAGLNGGAGQNASAVPTGSAIKNGAAGVGSRTLGTNDVGTKPGATKLDAPLAATAPASAKPTMRGFGAGVQAFGSSGAGQASIGDVARPEHTFTPPSANANAGMAALPLQLPKTVRPDEPANPSIAGTANGQALLDQQLASVAERGSDRSLFSPAHADDSVSWFPSAQAIKNADPKLAGLPAANLPTSARADPSLAELSMNYPELGTGTLPLASAKTAVKPEQPFGSVKSGVMNGITATLPGVNPPGLTDSRPQGSFAGLTPNGSVPDANQLSLAKSPDKAAPDSLLPGQKAGQSADVSANLPSAVPGGLSRAEGGIAYNQAPVRLDANGLPIARSPDGALPEGVLGQASPFPNGFDPLTGLPLAALPGQDRPESSNPWLDGEIGLNGEPSLPIARVVPHDLPQSGLGTAQPGLALVPDKNDLPLVALRTGGADAQASLAGARPDGQAELASALPSPGTKAGENADDPFAQVRPTDAVASLEPAELRPPLVKTTEVDGGIAGAKNQTGTNAAIVMSEPGLKTSAGDTGLTTSRPPYAADVSALSQPQLCVAQGDPSLAGTAAPVDGKQPDLVLAQLSAGTGPDASLGGNPPVIGDNGEPLLAIANLPDRAANEALLAAMRPTPDTTNPDLRTPVRTMPDTLAGATSPETAEPSTGNLAQAKAPEGTTVDKGLVGETKTSPDGAVAVNPVQPKTPGQKPETTGLSPEASRILALLDQTAPKAAGKAPTVVTPPSGQTTAVGPVPAGGDDQWAQKNLPLVKSLQKAKYYVQVGAFANPRSAKTAIEDVAKGYQVAVVPEKGTKQQVYKVFVGPLAEDEKGLLLYLFRSKGYRDAFIKQGQP